MSRSGRQSSRKQQSHLSVIGFLGVGSKRLRRKKDEVSDERVVMEVSAERARLALEARRITNTA